MAVEIVKVNLLYEWNFRYSGHDQGYPSKPLELGSMAGVIGLLSHNTSRHNTVHPKELAELSRQMIHSPVSELPDFHHAPVWLEADHMHGMRDFGIAHEILPQKASAHIFRH